MIATAKRTQELAEDWYRSWRELEGLERQERELQAKKDTARRSTEEAARQLAERVGRNIPLKVFTIGDHAVIVEHEKGIRLIEIHHKED